jgi:hypothetical protein
MITVFLLIQKRGREPSMSFLTKMLNDGRKLRNRVSGGFCEDAFGRDGHGHASKSKETLYLLKINLIKLK